jgi:hypothetical protein
MTLPEKHIHHGVLGSTLSAVLALLKLSHPLS